MKKEKSTLKMKFKDYVVSPCENAKDRFDLFREVKNKKGKDSLKVIGYGYSFNDALLRIAAEETSEKTDIVTLQEYVREYKNTATYIKQALSV